MSSIIEIYLGKTSYRIACEEGEEEKIIELTAKANKRIEAFPEVANKADDIKRLVMSILSAENEIEELKNNSKNNNRPFANSNNQNLEQCLYEIKGRIDELNNAVSEAINS